MIAYSVRKQEEARILRKSGHSIKEISENLKIAKSTASIWVRGIKLGSKAKKRIEKLREIAREKATKAKAAKIDAKRKESQIWAKEILNSTIVTPKLAQIFCSILYWGEGGKFTDNRIEFTNSDPAMIRTFMKLLRKGFEINESKLRANIHVHEYHNENTQRNFWSRITSIPLKNFNKSYLKPHTKKVIRENYQGCVRICYYSGDVAKKIRALYTELSII